MTRETSIDAWKYINENEILGKLQKVVYNCLYENPKITGNELRILLSSHSKSNSGVYTTRLSELERLGAVETVGKRICTITGRNVLIWQVTKKIPVKTIRLKPKYSELISFLKADDLEKHLNKHYASETFKKEVIKIFNELGVINK